MERIRTQRFAESVTRGVELIPPRVLERIGRVEFFEGDIYFAGGPQPLPDPHYATAWSPLHFRHAPADRRCQSVCFTGTPWHRIFDAIAVVHEAGHCLQYALGSYAWPWPFGNVVGLPPLDGPVSDYASDDYCEQFCEAFASWLCPAEILESSWSGVEAEALMRNGRELLAFFNELAGFPAEQLPRALR